MTVNSTRIMLDNDDPPPASLSISGASVAEGDAGTTTTLAFTVEKVTTTGETSLAVTVDYAVTGGTAEAVTDYKGPSAGTLTFAPGKTPRKPSA